MAFIAFGQKPDGGFYGIAVANTAEGVASQFDAAGDGLATVNQRMADTTRRVYVNPRAVWWVVDD